MDKDDYCTPFNLRPGANFLVLKEACYYNHNMKKNRTAENRSGEDLEVFQRFQNKGRLFSLILVSSFLFFPVQSIKAIPLTFAAVAPREGASVLTAWDNLFSYLEEKTGGEFIVQIFSDNETLVKQLRGNFIDLAFLDPALYLLERKRTPLRALAVAEKQGRAEERRYILASLGSVIYTPEHLEGAVFAYTSQEESVAGSLVSKAMLLNRGLNPETLFLKIVYAGDYESVFRAVVLGSVDAGMVTEEIISRKENHNYLGFVRVIDVSLSIPNNLIVAREFLDETLLSDLSGALLTLSQTDRGRELLSQLEFSGFTTPEEVDFSSLELYLGLYLSRKGNKDESSE